ncbi:hypothetical protein LTR12_003436 [Friedmanniomyces endolithicus]|nr:hypothetical protein LTR74_002862 [Friedmanniomyces endolithicus]KAK1822090.1 hypothetical protein LTR12_003436 [Friedmanniomyces endolithicus]
MSTSNPAPGVGGTAKDGGLSTAATVADGGPSGGEQDSQYLPPGTESSEKPQDGGLSTAATVSDGGPSKQAEDPDYKP